MRGTEEKQGSMFSVVSPEKRVPADHPLRRIKKMVEEILAAAHLVAAAYNLLRVAKLTPAAA